MRVLHIVDPGSPGGGGSALRTTAEVTARLSHADHTVLVLGGKTEVEFALRCGLAPIGSVAVSSRGRGLARIIRAYEHARGTFGTIHSWTARAGAIAVAAAPRRTHLVSAIRKPKRHRTSEVLKLTGARIIVPFEGVRRTWEEAGFGAHSISVIAPTVNPDDVPPCSRHSIRDRWGIPPRSNAICVGFLLEPAKELDATVAMAVASRLTLSGLDVRSVVHPDSYRRAEAEMTSHRLGFSEELLIVDDDLAEPWRIVSGLDVAVHIGGRRPDADLSPLLWAAATGVPVIAEDRGVIREMIDDESMGSLVPAGDVNAICARLAQLLDEPDETRRSAEAAAARTRDRFTIERYCQQLSHLYRTGPPR